MSTTEQIYALLVAANPVPDPEASLEPVAQTRPHLYVVDSRRTAMQTQPQQNEATEVPRPRRTRHAWLYAAAAFVLVAVIGATALMLQLNSNETAITYEVTTTPTSGTGTNDLTVWAPMGDGPWPVVYAVPGTDGSTGSALRDFDVFADELASHGVVVIGTDLTGARVDMDTECGYRYAQENASEYGGDPSLPVTFFGYSDGATGALIHGLGEDAYGLESTDSMRCPPGTERPQVIVSLNGCHSSYTEVESRIRFWGNQDAEITLISGADDDVCSPRQSLEAQELLTEAGYDATYVEIPDANHWEVIFHDLSYGTYKTLEPDDPAGQATIQAVLDAIGISDE